MSDDQDIESEERTIYAIIAGGCLPIVIGVLASADVSFDGGTTLSFALVVMAVVGLVRLVRRERIPRARAIR